MCLTAKTLETGSVNRDADLYDARGEEKDAKETAVHCYRRCMTVGSVGIIKLRYRYLSNKGGGNDTWKNQQISLTLRGKMTRQALLEEEKGG